ncbi:MAG: HAD-IA family hydrolase [Candidatus Saccharimonadales bacterium]
MAGLDPAALKRERQSANLTQKELAKRSGVAYSTLTKLEQGIIPSPSVGATQSLADAIGCMLSDLLSAAPINIKKNSDIKFIYFDIGGVLIHWLPSVHAYAERIDRPYNQVLKLFYENEQALAKGNMTDEDFKLLVALKLKLNMKGKAGEEAMKSWLADMRPILPAHNFLKELTNHYPVGLISNIAKGYFENFVQLELVPKAKYKTIIKSCDIGHMKPEHEMFEIATQAARVEPTAILFIDDSKVNVRAAERFGWQAEWFDEYDPQKSIKQLIAKYFS